MTTRAIPCIRLASAALTLTLSGCFAIVDVDRFHTTQTKPTPDSSALNQSVGYLNFKFSLVGMTPHVAQLFEYRIIDSNNFVQSRGVVNPLGGPDVVINVPQAVPTVNGPFHLDFYADVNGSGGYDGLGSVISRDHAWRIEPLSDYTTNGVVQVTFTHNTSFTDIDQFPSLIPNPSRDTGLGAIIHVSHADTLHGDLIQALVSETGSNRTVGLFRVPQISPAAFDMTIPGVVEPGAEYKVSIYADANGNLTYDNPATASGDLGWNLTGTASPTGLEVTLDVQGTTLSNVDVGAP